MGAESSVRNYDNNNKEEDKEDKFEESEIVNEKEEDSRNVQKCDKEEEDEHRNEKLDVHECDMCKFVAASKNDVEKHKKEIHGDNVAEIERLKRKLMLFSAKYVG